MKKGWFSAGNSPLDPGRAYLIRADPRGSGHAIVTTEFTVVQIQLPSLSWLLGTPSLDNGMLFFSKYIYYLKGTLLELYRKTVYFKLYFSAFTSVKPKVYYYSPREPELYYYYYLAVGLNLKNHSIIPCADFSFAQPRIKQSMMIQAVGDCQKGHTAIFYFRITTRSKAV